MFALVNLITTIEHNMHRIASLWDVAVSHLNCIVNHKLAPIRRYGVESLTRLCVQALGTTGKVDGVLSESMFYCKVYIDIYDYHSGVIN